MRVCAHHARAARRADMAEPQYPIDAVTESAMMDSVEPKGLGMSLDDLVKNHKSSNRGGGGRGGGGGGGDRLKVRAVIRKNTGGGGGGRGGGFGGRGAGAGPKKVCPR